jgi:hypothetical protein
MHRVQVLVASLAFSIGATAVPALADPSAQEILAKVAKKQYLAKTSGLKSISFDIDSPMFAMMGGEMGVHYVWKAPDKEKCTMTGADNPMIPKAMMEKQMGRLGRLCVGQSFAEEYDGFEMTAEKDGDLFKVSGTSTDETKDAKAFVLWVNSDYIPVKQETTARKAQMGQPPTQTMEYKTAATEDGKYYLAEFTQPGGMGGGAKLNWEKVNGILILTSMAMNSPMGEMKMSFINMKVNEPIDDSVFAVQ